MAKLLMLSGLVASGKSTEAEKIVSRGNWVRVNRDLLRTMLHFDKWTGNNEAAIIAIEKNIAGWCLMNGLSVVVDDTNLGQKHHDMWSELARKFGATFETKRIDTDLATCLERNKGRDKEVPEHVIKQMALQYGLVEAPKNGWILCDLDGTVCDLSHRLHYLYSDVENLVAKENKDWRGFFEALPLDTPRDEVIGQLVCSTESVDSLRDVIFVSARPETYRELSEGWLKQYIGDDYFTLIMRGATDRREDSEVKRDLYNKYLAQYKVKEVFDDRPRVIRQWQELGLKVNDVGTRGEF